MFGSSAQAAMGFAKFETAKAEPAMSIRTNVSFRYPAEFVRVSDDDGILSVDGAQWFVHLLKRIPGLWVDEDLCQEDWGVVIFASRDDKKFWIGLSCWGEGEHTWLSHCHHGPTAWLQRISSSGKREMQRIVTDLHRALTDDPAFADIIWYEEREMRKAQPVGSATPSEG